MNSTKILTTPFFTEHLRTTASVSYKLGVNGEKKVNENWDAINDNSHSTFNAGKACLSRW